jgi:hypothetical protein
MYDVLYHGSYGLETQYGYGTGVTASGNLGYQITSESDTELGNWTYYYLCDHNGTPGFYLGEWEGTAFSGPSIPGFPGFEEPISFILGTPLPLLPAAADVGAMTQWTYSVYANATSTLLQSGATVPQTGTVTDWGTGHTIFTPAGTFTNALKIVHDYEQNRSALQVIQLGGVTKATGTHYYVEGLGLVYEKVQHLTGSDGTGILVEKQLKAYTGLTPVTP